MAIITEMTMSIVGEDAEPQKSSFAARKNANAFGRLSGSFL